MRVLFFQFAFPCVSLLVCERAAPTRRLSFFRVALRAWRQAPQRQSSHALILPLVFARVSQAATVSQRNQATRASASAVALGASDQARTLWCR